MFIVNPSWFASGLLAGDAAVSAAPLDGCHVLAAFGPVLLAIAGVPVGIGLLVLSLVIAGVV